jgi:zinc and cadmium transporter
MVLASIIAANLAGGLLSVLAAALIAFAVLERWVPRLVSFAVGALLGVALLDLLPEAIESQAGAHAVFATLLVGLLVFFLLEKLALWRHSHGPGEPAHEHATQHIQAGATRPEGALIVLGCTISSTAC